MTNSRDHSDEFWDRPGDAEHTHQGGRQVIFIDLGVELLYAVVQYPVGIEGRFVDHSQVTRSSVLAAASMIIAPKLRPKTRSFPVSARIAFMSSMSQVMA